MYGVDVKERVGIGMVVSGHRGCLDGWGRWGWFFSGAVLLAGWGVGPSSAAARLRLRCDGLPRRMQIGTVGMILNQETKKQIICFSALRHLNQLCTKLLPVLHGFMEVSVVVVVHCRVQMVLNAHQCPFP